MNETYDFEERLIQFAGETILFIRTLPNSDTGRYYGSQAMRSSGSSALNYGEAKGTITSKDFIHKMTIVLKELKETHVSLRIMEYVKYGHAVKRKSLIQESKELASISAKMILNKKSR